MILLRLNAVEITAVSILEPVAMFTFAQGRESDHVNV